MVYFYDIPVFYTCQRNCNVLMQKIEKICAHIYLFKVYISAIG